MHSFQPSPNTWLWFVRTLPCISAENTSSSTSCVFPQSPRMFFHRCVCACRRATCFSTAEWECLWPRPAPFCSQESESAAACLACLCVSENARFTHVTTAEAAVLLSCFAGLRRAATHWLLQGLCSLHAWRGWPWHSYALEHGAWGFIQQCQVRGSAQNCPCSQLRPLIKIIVSMNLFEIV